MIKVIKAKDVQAKRDNQLGKVKLKSDKELFSNWVKEYKQNKRKERKKALEFWQVAV